MIEKHKNLSSFIAAEKYVHPMSNVLRYLFTDQAVRPPHHWWRWPRVLAWFRVLMVLSLVKPPASAGRLSRIGDYLLVARGPGRLLRAVYAQQRKGDYG
jgi:hypothetical protein